MGKERDKLLWQMGKKPTEKTNKEAHKEYMEKRIEENNLPPRMKKIIEEIESDFKNDKS